MPSAAAAVLLGPGHARPSGPGRAAAPTRRACRSSSSSAGPAAGRRSRRTRPRGARASQVRTSSRNAASAGVSRKSMGRSTYLTEHPSPAAPPSRRRSRRPCGHRAGVASPAHAPQRAPAHYEATDVRIDKFVVGPFENNVFVVRDKGSGDAVIIDAANEHDLLLEVSRATGVRRVLTTHGHWDHIQAVTALRDAGIEVGVAPADAEMLPSYDFMIPDDDVLDVGRPAAARHPHPRPHARLHLLPPRGPPRAVQRRHPLPRRAGQHQVRERELRPRSSTSIDRRLFTLDPEHAGASRATGSTPRSAPSAPTSTSGSSGAGDPDGGP